MNKILITLFVLIALVGVCVAAPKFPGGNATADVNMNGHDLQFTSTGNIKSYDTVSGYVDTKLFPQDVYIYSDGTYLYSQDYKGKILRRASLSNLDDTAGLIATQTNAGYKHVVFQKDISVNVYYFLVANYTIIEGNNFTMIVDNIPIDGGNPIKIVLPQPIVAAGSYMYLTPSSSTASFFLQYSVIPANGDTGIHFVQNNNTGVWNGITIRSAWRGIYLASSYSPSWRMSNVKIQMANPSTMYALVGESANTYAPISGLSFSGLISNVTYPGGVGTTTEIAAIPAPSGGMQQFNVTTKKQCYYSGTTWVCA